MKKKTRNLYFAGAAVRSTLICFLIFIQLTQLYAEELIDDLNMAKQAYANKDFVTAFKLSRILAEKGNAQAQFNLGEMYEKGNGVAHDYAEAIKWYTKSAEQGFSEAQNYLGVLYQNRNEDYAEATKWYRKAAEQGYLVAQLNLGSMYYYGKGVTQNYEEAARWYHLAAEQGDIWAQYFLGNMYNHGHGVSQDNVLAYMWFGLSASQGFEGAKTNRNILINKMTPKQIDEAQRLVREWKPKSN